MTHTRHLPTVTYLTGGRMDTVTSWSGTDVKALRDALRITQLEFAAALSVSERTIIRWERGNPVGKTSVPDLDTLLSRQPDQVRARFAQLRGDDVDRRDLFKATAAAAGLLTLGLDGSHADWLATGAGRPDAAAVDIVRQTLHSAMQLDDMLGSPAAQGIVIAQQQVTEAMLADVDTALRPKVLSLHAEWIGFAGALAWDAGEYATAARLYNLARDTAHEAEDPDLAAYMLCGLSQLAIWQHKPRLAMDHAVAAQAWVRDTRDEPLRVYADLRMAEAAAIAGQKHACLDALDRAGQRIGGIVPGHPGDSRAYFVGPAFFESYQGGCLTLVGEPVDAVAASRRAITALPATFTRDRAVTLLELQRGLIQLDEIDEAAAAVGQAARLTTQNRSPRLSAAIRDGRRALAPWAGAKAVRDLDAELAVRSIVVV